MILEEITMFKVKNTKKAPEAIGHYSQAIEYNGFLFDQLSILERIEAVTDDEKALKQIAIERRQIERKLYQSPPVIKEE